MSPIGTANLQHPAVAIRQRGSVTQLSTHQLATLRDAFEAVQRLGDDRGYQYHAGIHGLPLPKYCKIAHGQVLFLPWHRAYLYNFEMALQDQVQDATLAWWDWRLTREVPSAYAEETADGRRQTADGRRQTAKPTRSTTVRINDVALKQGASDEDRGAQVLSRYPETARQPGLPDAPPLPTKQDIDRLMGHRRFLDFQEQLEGFPQRRARVGRRPHERHPVRRHDPIFWAHHTMIDRIWRLWQLAHPRATLPPDLLRSPLPPFRLTVKQTLDVTSLGYDYAVSTAHDPGRP